MSGSNGRGVVEADVAIIGGGPTGSTCASIIRKYRPDLRVVVIEKEAFPREHIGESQLPSISFILNEMGVWDKVEAAGFPIKIGASYTWGAKADRWDFEFIPVESWKDEPRPSKFVGQRQFTAFQVERSIYDHILLEHSRELGAEILQPVRVVDIPVDGDRVLGLVLEDGRTVKAKYYVDGSGTVGILRRALGIYVDAPDELKNIATWDYWDNAEWAVEVGIWATRIQIRSLPYGWMWYIPVSKTRTSIGLVCPAEKYRAFGLSPAELYKKAIEEQKEVQHLVRHATPSGQIRSCKDWSQLSERIVGENWFVAGEAAGFADPILSAGMSLAHASGRDAAYSIMELIRGEHDPKWLRQRYDERNRTNINQHIQFAQYWYVANSCFTDLKEHCARIAARSSERMSPDRAWRWLSQGGFTSEILGQPAFGTCDVASTKQILELFDDKDRKATYLADGYNVFKLNLHNAKPGNLGVLENGRITMAQSYERANAKLAIHGYYKLVHDALLQTSDAKEMCDILRGMLGAAALGPMGNQQLTTCLQALDTMIQESWVLRSKNSKRPVLRVDNQGSRFIRSPEETAKAVSETPDAPNIKFNI